VHRSTCDADAFSRQLPKRVESLAITSIERAFSGIVQSWLYRCQCESDERTSFSPLAELLQERSSPELVYLETKFAALVSYGLTVELLKELLPISQELSTTAIRQRVRRTAQRLEDELGEERQGQASSNHRVGLRGRLNLKSHSGQRRPTRLRGYVGRQLG
jgi:hypothetical protein